MSDTPIYELIYWPMLQGRGEFPRLLFEDAGVPYLDVARLAEDEQGGIPAVMRLREDGNAKVRPFAPPMIKVGDHVIAQTSVVCEYVAGVTGLLPSDDLQVLTARQHLLTILDVVDEVHDTHHPLTSAKSFEAQQEAAIEAARSFTTNRLPLRLAYFESLLSALDSGWLVTDHPVYTDIAMFQLLSGLQYAFPRAMEHIRASMPRCMALQQAVKTRPGIAQYLQSDRRLPFNEHGIFRYYEALDFSPDDQ